MSKSGYHQRQLTSLERRVEFWTDRFHACKKAGRPEMLAACTAMLQNLHDPTAAAEAVRSFDEVTRRFKEPVVKFVTPFLQGVETVMELFVGCGIFAQELAPLVPEYWGIELVQEAVSYVRDQLMDRHGFPRGPAKRIMCGSADMIEGLWTTHPHDSHRKLDAVLAFRGCLHQPYKEWRRTVAASLRVLSEDGLFIAGELFRDELVNMVPEREVHAGTWYRWRHEFQEALGPRMKLVLLSDIVDNDGDPCRIAAWRRTPRPRP